MNKVIVLGPESTRLKIIKLDLEERFEVEVITFNTDVEALRLLVTEENKVKGLIVLNDYNYHQNFKLNHNEKILPPIFFELAESGKEKRKQLNDFLTNVGLAPATQDIKNGFMNINFYEFMTFNLSPCDIYIRIGSNNYIKIINKDEIYTKELLDSYRSKQITKLFIRNNDLNTFNKNLYDYIHDNLKKSNNITNRLTACIAGLEFVEQGMTNLGIGQKHIEIALETVDEVLKSIGQHPEIYKRVHNFLSVKSYLSEHSIAVSIISCAIAREMKMSNVSTLKKLAAASLFHDISLKDKKLSLIVNTDSMEYLDIDEKTKKSFSEHIYESVDFIKQIPSLNFNAENIILEHHERPDGRGFPRGLDSFNITPLSSIFILAEEFVHQIFRYGFTTKERDKILERISGEYHRGIYKDPMNALLRLFT